MVFEFSKPSGILIEKILPGNVKEAVGSSDTASAYMLGDDLCINLGATCILKMKSGTDSVKIDTTTYTDLKAAAAALASLFKSGGSNGGGVGSGEEYTLTEKNKLASITAIFTTSLKNAYDAIVTASSGYATQTWVTSQLNALVNGAGAALDTLNELASALGNDANFSTTITNLIGLKAPINNPTFTGTVGGVTKAHVGLSAVDNTSDADKPVSTAQANAIALKQTKAIQVHPVSVAATGWTLVSGFYEKTISDSNITESSIVDVIPDNASVSIVQTAEFTSLTTSASGTVKVYANNVPTGTITVTLNIWL